MFNKIRTSILAVILFGLTGYSVAATNKVVVIPMGGGTTQWALVKGADGSIITQSGGISATRLGNGVYMVTFGRTVTGHAVITSSQDTLPRIISARVCGGSAAVDDPETLICTYPYNTTNVVDVNTYNSSGTRINGNFYISVLP